MEQGKEFVKNDGGVVGSNVIESKTGRVTV
jgi:hypothetical protein